ncbi:MAG: oligosaccharide flippase family protein [Caldilineaceae bacterium]|nr:oligosaccharide flippase family protein [Caldilineaceae bacterium]
MNLHAGSPEHSNTGDNDPRPTRSTGRRVLINTGALAGSSLWRIGLSFVLQLLIANRLGIEGLGQYATALAYLNVSQVLSELGLPQLLIRDLAQSPVQRRSLFWQSLLMQFAAGILIWLGIWALTSFSFFTETTRLVLIIVTASLPFFALSSICITLFQADERMEVVMGVEMLINGLILVGSVALLWMNATIIHLAFLLVLTQIISGLLYLILLKRGQILDIPQVEEAGNIAATPDSQFFTRNSILTLWQRSRPFYGLAIANVLLHRLDLLLLSAVAGELITGIYSAAYLVVRVFLILGQTYWQSLYPTLSRLRLQSVDGYHRLAEMAIRYGLLALLPASALICGLADPLLRLIFPEESYAASVPVLRLLIWAAPLFLLTTYCINLLLIERHPRLGMAVASVQILVTLAILPPLSRLWQAPGSGMAILSAVTVSSVWGLWLLRRQGIPAGLGRGLSILLGVTAGIGTGLYLLAENGPPQFWPIYGLGAVCLYFIILLRTGLLSTADLSIFRHAIIRS